METILFEFLKYPLLIFLYYSKDIVLDYSQWQRIFCLVETMFFHSHFFETIIAIRGRPQCFLKIWFLLEEIVFFNFFQILIRMEVAFRSNEITCFEESFILASGNGFLINYKTLCFYSEFFFFWWTKFLKLGVNQFSSIFSNPNSGSIFSS